MPHNWVKLTRGSRFTNDKVSLIADLTMQSRSDSSESICPMQLAPFLSSFLSSLFPSILHVPLKADWYYVFNYEGSCEGNRPGCAQFGGYEFEVGESLTTDHGMSRISAITGCVALAERLTFPPPEKSASE